MTRSAVGVDTPEEVVGVNHETTPAGVGWSYPGKRNLPQPAPHTHVKKRRGHAERTPTGPPSERRGIRRGSCFDGVGVAKAVPTAVGPWRSSRRGRV